MNPPGNFSFFNLRTLTVIQIAAYFFLPFFYLFFFVWVFCLFVVFGLVFGGRSFFFSELWCISLKNYYFYNFLNFILNITNK